MTIRAIINWHFLLECRHLVRHGIYYFDFVQYLRDFLSRAIGYECPYLTHLWGATLILYLGLAHIIAESGLVFLRGPITAQAFTWHVLGVAGMGAPSAVALDSSIRLFVYSPCRLTMSN